MVTGCSGRAGRGSQEVCKGFSQPKKPSFLKRLCQPHTDKTLMEKMGRGRGARSHWTGRPTGQASRLREGAGVRSWMPLTMTYWVTHSAAGLPFRGLQDAPSLIQEPHHSRDSRSLESPAVTWCPSQVRTLGQMQPAGLLTRSGRLTHLWGEPWCPRLPVRCASHCLPQLPSPRRLEARLQSLVFPPQPPRPARCDKGPFGAALHAITSSRSRLLANPPVQAPPGPTSFSLVRFCLNSGT